MPQSSSITGARVGVAGGAIAPASGLVLTPVGCPASGPGCVGVGPGDIPVFVGLLKSPGGGCGDGPFPAPVCTDASADGIATQSYDLHRTTPSDAELHAEAKAKTIAADSPLADVDRTIV